VIVTDRGAPAYVLLSHKDYCRLSGVAGASIVDLLRQPEGEDIDFDPPRLDNITRPADL
jgi:hypothetical protein